MYKILFSFICKYFNLGGSFVRRARTEGHARQPSRGAACGINSLWSKGLLRARLGRTCVPSTLRFSRCIGGDVGEGGGGYHFEDHWFLHVLAITLIHTAVAVAVELLLCLVKRLGSIAAFDPAFSVKCSLVYVYVCSITLVDRAPTPQNST